MKILLVDREPTLLQVFEIVLLKLLKGASILTAQTHDEGLRLLMEHPDIKAIILDDDPDLYPGLLSAAILTYVRENGLRCIIMAASSSLDTNRRMVELGCTHMVPTDRSRVWPAKEKAPYALVGLLAGTGEPIPQIYPEPTKGAFGPFAPKATEPAGPPIPGAGYW